jgi:hypothetical protein
VLEDSQLIAREADSGAGFDDSLCGAARADPRVCLIGLDTLYGAAMR